MLKGVEKKLLFDKRKKTQNPLIKKMKEKEHNVYRITQTQWRRGIFGNFSSTPLLPIFSFKKTLFRRDFFLVSSESHFIKQFQKPFSLFYFPFLLFTSN